MKPLIGIIANKDKNIFKMPTSAVPFTYTSSIEKAGGVPVVIPVTGNKDNLFEDMMQHVQGFLFPGGGDIDPSFFNESPRKELGDVDRILDDFQMDAVELAMSRKKPVLGICRGAQLLNVALGGTLVQDISTQFETPTLKHMQETITYDTNHEVRIETGSRLHDLFGSHIQINSIHHQSIKEPGKDLVITARASDGVVEAAQHKTLPVDLIQWHPELMMQKNNDMLPLFRAFVESCKKH